MDSLPSPDLKTALGQAFGKDSQEEPTNLASPQTIPQHFLKAARIYGDRKIAMRQKQFGIWEETTWQESFNEVRDLTLGLIQLGLNRGDRVAIIGDNDREYIWADLAVLSAGATLVGIFIDSIPSEIEYILNHSDATFVFAKDQEQCDKLLAVKGSLPLVKKVVYWDDRGLWNYQDDWLINFDAVQALGHRMDEEGPGCFEKIVALGDKDEPATFCYTSGTTGRPKGVVLSHQNLILMYDAVNRMDPRPPTDDHMSFLSLAWVAEHVMGVTPHAVNTIVLNFPESPNTLQQNIREIAPEEIMYNSRLWENLVSMVEIRMSDSTWINRKLYSWFLPIGYEVADRMLGHKRIDPWLRLKYSAGNLLVFEPLCAQLGLSRVRTALTTGAALSAEVVRFFQALGIHIKQLYGVTETGIAAMHQKGEIDFYSVGRVIPGFKIRISSEGEILINSPALFLGYHKDEETTKQAVHVDPDGIRWFRTGDAGNLTEDGRLIYYDRLKDMIELPSGEKYSPQYIEGRLKFNPVIRDVLIIGGGKQDFVSAIITIDFENVGRWCERHGLPYTTFLDLSQKPEVYEMLKNVIEGVNENLAPPTRIKRFVSLHKEFDADEGEMTRTRKLRRGFLLQRYSEIIEAMYTGQDFVRVTATVQYRDGRVRTLDTNLHVATVETEEKAPV